MSADGSASLRPLPCRKRLGARRGERERHRPPERGRTAFALRQYKYLLLSAKVFPSDIKNRLNPHDEDSAFSFICFLLPKHINDEQKYTF